MFAKVAHFFVVQPIYVNIRFQKRHFLESQKVCKENTKKTLDGGGMNEVQTSSAALHI